MKTPTDLFLPVCTPYLAGNESKYVNEALESGWISSSGKYVQQFEEAFAEYCGVKHAVAVCNGTVALHLALVAMGIGPGDEVIIPDFTMIASAFAVCYTGAKPVFVDADRSTWNIDPELLEQAISPRTKAIMPVHIMGLCCDMTEIRRIADKHALLVLEDAAESHGALHAGKKAGSFSNIAAFSFFANKNITTGEGGMIVTDNPDLYEKSMYYKNLCFPLSQNREYTHNHIGFNYRMSNLHAAIGLAQCEKIEYYTARRIANNQIYREQLKNIPGISFQQDGRSTNGERHVHWMNAILVNANEYGMNRDELMNLLRQHNIETRKLFTGMHKQKSLIDYGCNSNDSFPVSTDLGDNGMYLPSSGSLDREIIERVCAVIHEGQTK